MKWYDRAKAALRARGLTYQDVAEALHSDLTANVIGHKLRGRSPTRVEEFHIISELCGESASKLLGQSGVFVTDADERRMVLLVRRLNEDQKRRILDAGLEMLSEEDGESLAE